MNMPEELTVPQAASYLNMSEHDHYAGRVALTALFAFVGSILLRPLRPAVAHVTSLTDHARSPS